jgi:excinuclease ABC subunit C
VINLTNLPRLPGCYIFKDRKLGILYIGKAKDLKKRISSYFSRKTDVKTSRLVESIYKIETIITDNETEALILENVLIKKHKPKYNIDLKNSDRYAYLLISDEEFPRLLVARSKEDKKILYGPFTSASERSNIKRFLTRSLRLRTCKRMRKKGCLRYHIKLCDGPCMGLISKSDYNDKIRICRQVLKGNTEKVISDLKKAMREESTKYRYEKALELRDIISSLISLEQKQKVERNRKYNEDLINFRIVDGHVYLLLFKIYKGTLNSMHEYSFRYYDDFLRHFLMQYYDEINKRPKELIAPKGNDDLKIYLKSLGIRLVVPKRSVRKELLDLADKNIEIVFFGDVSKARALKQAIKLEELPSVIECFDISHLSGTSTVGAMVSFRNAKPDPSNYRRFKVKPGNDDYASIAEVIRRRYSRLKTEAEEMPSLIIVDGGRGQLNAALDELSKLGLKIPSIGIAKKEEEIHLPGIKIPLKLRKHDKALLFLQEIRDEAHRFAISYNRLLRSRRITE